jgi:hypothetical protein
MDLMQLLEQHGVDVAALDPAPTVRTRQDHMTRIRRMPPWPCTLCGQLSPTAWVAETPLGPRWVELCGRHAVQVGKSHGR